MHLPNPPRRVGLALLACSMLASAYGAMGCAASSRYMTKVDALPLGAPAGKALLVFMRPSGFVFGTNFTLVDAQGRYLGEILAASYHAVPVEPGPIAVYAAADNDSALQGEVAAGSVCYILVDVGRGVLRPSVNLLPIRRGTRRWRDHKLWLERSTPYRVELAAGQASLSASQARARVQAGEASWRRYDKRAKLEHTLAADDCEPSPAAEAPTRPAAPPAAADPAAPPAAADPAAPPAAADPAAPPAAAEPVAPAQPSEPAAPVASVQPTA